MPVAQKNLSADTKRSILQHLMFGMLGLLILMNWTVHRPLDYKPFNEAFRLTDTVLNNRSKLIVATIVEIAKENNSNYENVLQLKASTIVSNTKIIVENLDSITRLLSDSKKCCDTFGKRRLGNFALSLVRNYYAEIIFGVMAIDSTSPILNYIPLNKKSLNEYKALLDDDFLFIDYRSKRMVIAILGSLKNDLINTQQELIYRIFEQMHENGCNFGRENRPLYLMNDRFFFQEEVQKMEIIIGSFWSFSKRFSTIKVDNGNIFDSILNTEMIAYWQGIAKHLGKNTVSGSISKIFKQDTITRPFSFSYFVSAPGIAFHLDKANVCYVAVPNPISISVPGYPADKIKLKVADAKVSKTEDGRFEVFFSKIPLNKVYAYVEATNEQGRTSTVHSMELKVKNLPAPVTNLERFKESVMSIDSFFANESLQLFSSDLAFQMDYDVVSFQVECITHKHKYIEPITVYGAEYSNSHELMSVFNAATVGDRFIFSNIRAKATNGKKYEALPVSILLK